MYINLLKSPFQVFLSNSNTFQNLVPEIRLVCMTLSTGNTILNFRLVYTCGHRNYS